MSCAEIQARLADDVLGEAADHDELERHLEACSVCAAERAAFEEAVALLREMDWPVVEPVLAAPQRARVEKEAAQPARTSWRRPLRIGAVAAGLAAAVAFFALTAPRLPVRVPPPAEYAAVPSAPQPRTSENRTTETAPPASASRPSAAPNSGQKARFEALDSLGSVGGAQPAVPAETSVPLLLADAREAGVAKGMEGGVVGGVVGGTPGPPTGASSQDFYQRRMSESNLRQFALAVPGVASGCEGCAQPSTVDTQRLFERAPAFRREPPPQDMSFQRQGTNPFVPTERDALSTFGLDVDTASFSLARNYILRGMLPPPAAVRVEEFVNALPQDYAPPDRGTFAIHLEGTAHPFQPGDHLLRVGLKAREVRARERKPANLTFVIDVSGSMAMENRLGLVKRSLRVLVNRLDERDRIGIVVYGTRGRVVLESTPASDRMTVLRAIDSLRPEGSTNLEEGLDLGYRMAVDNASRDANNRVILCTDGVANNGITNPDALLERIHAQSGKRVFLTALGFGMGNYNDALLQKLADQGDGQYAYIDDDLEAERFFLRDLSGVLEVVAREAKVQVEFDPSLVASYRLLGYEKRDVADEDFRNDDVDGGEVGAGHTVTALYELKLRGVERAAVPERIGSVTVRYVDPETHAPAEERAEIRGRQFRSRFEQASPGFRTTALAARFAEHLRASRFVREETLADVLAAADRLPPGTLREPEVEDLLDVMDRAARLSGDAPPRRRQLIR
jgi:Ca-activated chloride channel family protein